MNESSTSIDIDFIFRLLKKVIILKIKVK